MHDSAASRVGEIKKEDRPLELKGLPDDTHLVTGTLEGNGAVALATEKAKLSSKVIKLERTESGGIDYQVAIFVNEPVAPVVSAPVSLFDDENSREGQAVLYFTEKGFKKDQAVSQVKRFGVDRVLAMRDKDLDDELTRTVKSKSAS